MSSPVPPQTVPDRQQERADEYGTWVAVAAIDLEGGRAFNPGDAVPNGHIDRGIVRPDQVAKVTTKAGRAAAGIDENPKG